MRRMRKRPYGMPPTMTLGSRLAGIALLLSRAADVPRWYAHSANLRLEKLGQAEVTQVTGHILGDTAFSKPDIESFSSIRLH
jgi:hypothetical protein